MIDLPNLQSALLHTLWQGPLIALVLSAVLALLPARRPNARYAVATMALVVFILAFFVTWSLPAARPPDADTQYIVSETVGPGQTAKAVWPAVPTITVGSARERPAAPGFSAILLPLWMAGALCMLLRLLWLLRATRALAHTATQPVASPLLETFETLCRALKVPARTALRISASVATPVALGLLHPLVILPAGYITALTPEQLRAVLAHELAHIRRHDYLINLLQLLAEAAFYFNPALWWINRQIRLEREACCDHLAAQYAGGPLDYAAALASIARHSPAFAPPQPALAMHGPVPTPGPLLDRVRRLLLPAHRPHLRLPWYSLAATLALTLLCLLATYTTTQAATRIITTYLQMDNEARIAYLKELDPLPTPSNPEEMLRALRAISGDVRIFGRLVPPEGSELDHDQGSLIVSTGQHSMFTGMATYTSSGVFSGTCPNAPVYIYGWIPNFEPIFAGPFVPSERKTIGGIEIPLTVANPARILLRDESDNPVPNATVGISYEYFQGFTRGIDSQTTDANGQFLLEQSTPPVPVNLSIAAPGYPATQFGLLEAPAGQDTILRMVKGHSVEVFLRNKVTHAPVENASFRLLRSGNLQPGRQESHPAESLGAGRYRLLDLDRGMASTLAILAPGLGGTVATLEPKPDGHPIDIDVPEIYLNATIEGNLEPLKDYEGEVRIVLNAIISDADGMPMVHLIDLDSPVVTLDGNKGRFTITGLPPCQVLLHLGRHAEMIQLDGIMVDYVIRLDPPVVEADCTLDIKLESPPGLPRANGRVSINIYDGENPTTSPDIEVPIVDGTGTARVPSGVTLALSLSGVPGYGFEPGQNGHVPTAINHAVPAGAQQTSIAAKLVATGAITGTAITENGAPLHHNWIRVSKHVEGQEELQSLDAMPIDASGAFAFRGLPLGNTYSVAVEYRDQEYAQSVALTQAQPVANLQITPPPIPEQRTIRVEAFQPDGERLRGFHANVVLDTTPYAHLGSSSPSNVVRIGPLDTGVAGKVHVIPDRDYQPATVPLTPDATAVSVTVMPGRRARGRVLDQHTGQPVSGIQFVITLDHARQLECKSNEAGYFTFTNLPDEPVALSYYRLPRHGHFPLQLRLPLNPDGSTVVHIDQSLVEP
jgi:beta-lactamase regulating signal transducer with metallopeptidase domain